MTSAVRLCKHVLLKRFSAGFKSRNQHTQDHRWLTFAHVNKQRWLCSGVRQTERLSQREQRNIYIVLINVEVLDISTAIDQSNNLKRFATWSTELRKIAWRLGGSAPPANNCSTSVASPRSAATKRRPTTFVAFVYSQSCRRSNLFVASIKRNQDRQPKVWQRQFDKPKRFVQVWNAKNPLT